MKLKLVIEPCSISIKIAFGYTNKLIYCSLENELKTPDCRDISSIIAHGLHVIGKKSQDIEAIAVNVGPGRLTSVRSGVSFANGLAFSLNIPIYPFYSFELIGYEAWKKFSLPALCTLNSTDENAYLCLYDNASIKILKYGKLNCIVENALAGIDELVVAGDHINIVKQLFDNIIIHDSGIVSGKASTFFEIPYLNENRKLVDPAIAIPINDQSREFNE
jgi:tRNA A37 threonylcarbamoyladenosine modification protein TsaB